MESSSTAARHTRDNSVSAQQPINDNSAPAATADGNTKIKSRSIFKRVKNRLSKIRNGLGKSSKKPAEQTDTLPSSSPSPAFPMGRPRSIQERESERESERRSSLQSLRQSLRQSERRSSRDRSRPPSKASTAADRSQKEERRLPYQSRQSSLHSSIQSVRHRSRPPSIASIAADSNQEVERRLSYQSIIVTQKEKPMEEKSYHGISTSSETQEEEVSLQSQEKAWESIGEHDVSKFDEGSKEYKDLTDQLESMSKFMGLLDPNEQAYLSIYKEYKVLEQRLSLLEFPALKTIPAPRAPTSIQSAQKPNARVIVEVKAAPSAYAHMCQHGFATAEDLHKWPYNCFQWRAFPWGLLRDFRCNGVVCGSCGGPHPTKICKGLQLGWYKQVFLPRHTGNDPTGECDEKDCPGKRSHSTQDHDLGMFYTHPDSRELPEEYLWMELPKPQAWHQYQPYGLNYYREWRRVNKAPTPGDGQKQWPELIGNPIKDGILAGSIKIQSKKKQSIKEIAAARDKEMLELIQNSTWRYWNGLQKLTIQMLKETDHSLDTVKLMAKKFKLDSDQPEGPKPKAFFDSQSGELPSSKFRDHAIKYMIPEDRDWFKELVSKYEDIQRKHIEAKDNSGNKSQLFALKKRAAWEVHSFADDYMKYWPHGPTGEQNRKLYARANARRLEEQGPVQPKGPTGKFTLSFSHLSEPPFIQEVLSGPDGVILERSRDVEGNSDLEIKDSERGIPNVWPTIGADRQRHIDDFLKEMVPVLAVTQSNKFLQMFGERFDKFLAYFATADSYPIQENTKEYKAHIRWLGPKLNSLKISGRASIVQLTEDVRETLKIFRDLDGKPISDKYFITQVGILDDAYANYEQKLNTTLKGVFESPAYHKVRQLSNGFDNLEKDYPGLNFAGVEGEWYPGPHQTRTVLRRFVWPDFFIFRELPAPAAETPHDPVSTHKKGSKGKRKGKGKGKK